MSDIYVNQNVSNKVKYNRRVEEHGAGLQDIEMYIYTNEREIRADKTSFQSQEGGK